MCANHTFFKANNLVLEERGASVTLLKLKKLQTMAARLQESCSYDTQSDRDASATLKISRGHQGLVHRIRQVRVPIDST